MKISDLRKMLNEMPSELDNKDIVIRDIGKLEESENWYKKDSPILMMYYDEDTEELAVCDEKSTKMYEEISKTLNESKDFLNYEEFLNKQQNDTDKN